MVRGLFWLEHRVTDLTIQNSLTQRRAVQLQHAVPLGNKRSPGWNLSQLQHTLRDHYKNLGSVLAVALSEALNRDPLQGPSTLEGRHTLK
jgi:hypothetical protein